MQVGGQSKTLTFKFAYPTSLGTGTYFLIPQADTGNTIIEANEANNVPDKAALPQPNIQAAFIDLRAAAATKPTGSLTPGGAASTTVTVENSSNIPVNQNVTITLSFTTDASGAGGTQVTQITKKLSIKNGATKNVPIKFTIPANLAAGTYFVKADITALAGETSTTNNSVLSESIAIA